MKASTSQHFAGLADADAMRRSMASFFDAVRRMTPDDAADIGELFLEIKSAEEAGDRRRANAALATLIEFFAARPEEYKAVSPARTQKRPPALQKWVDHVAKTVRRLRQEREWSQEHLAEKSGLPQSHISRIERGSLSASRKTVAKLARALGVAVSKIDPSDD